MDMQHSAINRTVTLSTKKWTMGAAAMLLGASLVLSACSDTSEPVLQSTPIATLEVVEPPAIEATAVVEDSDTMTDTEEVTETDGVTETEDITGTEGMTGTEDATGTGDVTGTEGITGTDGVTETEGITETEGMTGTDTMTETGAAEGDTATTATTAPMVGVTGVATNQYVRASTLLDYDFENLNNEISGDLEDLLIDLSSGRILFTSIEYGGVLDLGDKDIVVPLSAFTIGTEGELVLNIDEARLESYPDVGNNWPDLNDPAWDDDVNTYWDETGIDVGPGFDTPATNVIWASDLIGENVADLGFGAGSVLDILVNLGTGYANYVIVDYGEGLDTDPYIIPLGAFDITMRDAGLTYGLDFTPEILESAPRFSQETYPEGTALDQDFGDRLESAWNDLGFSNDLNNDGQID